MKSSPKFSLVLCTVGRELEPIKLLKSLSNQSYKEFELIIVDQNEDERISNVLRAHSFPFKIIYIKNQRGLSKSRNVGLKHISGDVVAFPDDDSWYPENLLKEVEKCFLNDPATDGFIGLTVDEKNIPSTGCRDTNSSLVTRFSLLRMSVSNSIFLGRQIIKTVGDFDETLGIGAGTPWGASEETDYLIRVFDAGFVLHFNPDIKIFHPQIFLSYDQKYLEKAFSYGAGFGRILRKHRYPLGFIAWKLFKTFGGCVLAVLRFKIPLAKYYLYSFRGRLKGVIS
ncbi:MAG: glycosyltransferase family 2 protein [Deltaproteobacteria bacterium]|nr:glycosyltransferase family 2 protein [Deltaproteobacteria bacterium]